MLREIILSVIISIDTFLAAAAYRSCGIKIPVSSAVVINAIGAVFLGLSLVFSRLMGNIVPEKRCEICGFIILTSMGIITIFKSLIRNLVRRLSERGELSLPTGNSGIVVKLYLDDTADITAQQMKAKLRRLTLTAQQSFLHKKRRHWQLRHLLIQFQSDLVLDMK